MNVLLWFLQGFLGVVFLGMGVNHFIVPPGLPAQMAWMYDLPTNLHILIGLAEILAGLGLILPGLLRLQTRLTPLAAVGVVLLMAGAAIWHVPRGEFPNSLMNVVLGGLAGFVAYGRWKISPLKDKSTA